MERFILLVSWRYGSSSVSVEVGEKRIFVLRVLEQAAHPSGAWKKKDTRVKYDLSYGDEGADGEWGGGR